MAANLQWRGEQNIRAGGPRYPGLLGQGTTANKARCTGLLVTAGLSGFDRSLVWMCLNE